MQRISAVLAVIFLSVASYGGSDPLTLLQYQTTNYRAIFSKSQVFSGNEKTWNEMYQSVRNQFIKYKDQLRVDWKSDGQVLEATFMMNVVNNMWGFGDVRNPDGSYTSPACVANNRYILPTEGVLLPGQPFPMLTKIFPHTYLESPVGCCNDYAMLLYMLMNMAGIPATQLGTPGHIYVQADLDGKTYLLDATFNFMVALNNDQFLNHPPDAQISYTVFPYSMSNPDATDLFRHRAGARRMNYLISQGWTQHDSPKDYPQWNQFERWMKLGYIEARPYSLIRQ